MANDQKTNPNIIPPDDDTPYLSAIINQFGTDTNEPSVQGLGYSPDNGVHFYVTDTIQGRKYRQEDADRLWKYLEPKISNLIDEKLQNVNKESGGESTSETE